VRLPDGDSGASLASQTRITARIECKCKFAGLPNRQGASVAREISIIATNYIALPLHGAPPGGFT
jgi:hypothetical protein